MKTVAKIIFYIQILNLLVSCLPTIRNPGEVVQSPFNNVSPEAELGSTITPTKLALPSSPSPIPLSDTFGLSGTPSPSPVAPNATPTSSTTPNFDNPENLITPVVSPRPPISGTQNPKYCYDVPSPQLYKNNSNTDVYLSGVFYLCDSYHSAIDLDRIIIGDYFVTSPARNLAGADIWLRIGNVPDEALLLELDDVFLAATFENVPPTIEQCIEKFSGYPYGGLLFIIGDAPEILDEYGCVKTTEGRIGYLQLEEINPLGELSVKVRFVIWQDTMK